MHLKNRLLSILAQQLTILVCLGFSSVLFLPAIVSGQGTSDIDPELAGIPANTAPVKVDGKTLFFVRGIASYPAEQRAATIGKRIEKAAANDSISSDSVLLVAREDRVMIYAGNEFIMSVYDADAEMEGIIRTVLAELFQQKIKVSIDSYRYERSRPALKTKMVNALIATGILIVILFGMLWLIRKIRNLLERKIQARIDSVENISFRLIRSHQLWKAFFLLFRVFRFVVILLLITGFLQYVLGQFPWTNKVALYTLGLFLDPVIKMGKGLLGFLPSLAFLIVIYVVTRYLLKLIKLFFAGIQDESIRMARFDPEWAMPTFKILRLFVIIFALVLAYPYIPGSNTSAFKGISVFLGVLLSLGSSSFIANIIAGYSMTYRGAFKKGDRIQVGDVTGFVEEQKLMVTRVRTLKNEDVVIPNSTMLSSNIVNYSARVKDTGLILHTTVGIGYETPWRQVDAMLKLAAEKTEGLLKNPPPFVIKQSLGDFAVNYEINAYCNDASKIPFYYNILHQNILDIFNENNVQIMTPAYEGDPETPKVVPREQWNTPLANERREEKGERREERREERGERRKEKL
jgi:small-conductance mechanosensitive channel